MKKLGKRLLSYALVLAMLMSLYTPAYGAQMGEEAHDAQMSESDTQTSDSGINGESGTARRRECGVRIELHSDTGR